MLDRDERIVQLKEAGCTRALEMLSKAIADGTLVRIPILTTKEKNMTNPNEMYMTKRLKQENRSVVANRLTTDAEPNVFTEERKKQCAERRGFGKRKERKSAPKKSASAATAE